MKQSILLSCDPSINNVGVAIWNTTAKKLMAAKLVHPKVGNRENEYDKSLSVLVQIKEFIEQYQVNRMILEVPAHWAVAGFEARETGSIAKLMLVVGLLYSLKPSLDELKIVKPADWKGQLPKGVMVNRLQKHYEAVGVDLAKLDPNVADAIGIGHFYLYGRV